MAVFLCRNILVWISGLSYSLMRTGEAPVLAIHWLLITQQQHVVSFTW